MAHGVPNAPQIDALRFFTSSGLWLGLAAAAVLVFATVLVRRRAEPI